MIKKSAITVLLCISVALIAGCSSKVSKEQPQGPSMEENNILPLELPATFTGSIPCPDCEKVDIILNLRPDNLYQLRKTYRLDNGEQRVEAQMRNWRFDPQNNLVILGKGKGRLKTYRISTPDTLRFLDIEGEAEQISYDLHRLDTYDPFQDVVKMRGMFSSTGNTHRFTECSSGITFPVDPSGKFYELDRSYRNTPHEKSKSLLVSIKGKLLTKGEQNQSKDIIVVEGFKRIYPDQDCEGAVFEDSLFGVRWKAVEIGGKPVEKNKIPSVPFMILEAEGKRVRGNSGCNRFFGSFFFKGDVFIFNTLASTRMACPGSIIMEDAFLRALDETESFIMQDGRLILLDKNDEAVMKLESRDWPNS